ncbi:MAG: sodium:proton exchanger [Lentisphaerales bacterium]|nr:MAG: sodium:proton exchanger [Lentisphaerales bacterium]
MCQSISRNVKRYRFWIVGLLCILCAYPLLGAQAGQEADPGISERMMLLVIQLGLILAMTRIGGSLFRRLKMPAVLGELLAGMIIGPHLLGAISFYGFPHGLFPLQPGFPISAELYGICSVAAIVLLFNAGLETDIRLFIKYSLAGGVVGLCGVVVAFVLGDLVSVVFLRTLFNLPVGFGSPECLILGVISTPTSVGITVRVLAERRKFDLPEGVTILAGAVFDDILGIILLAVVLGIVGASGPEGEGIRWGSIAAIAGKAVGVWLVATAIGIAAARRISLLLKLFRDKLSIAIMALSLALILSGLFEEAGLAMIIGAYVMGLSLSRTDISYVVREKLEPVYALLVPVFFCVMGMLVDFRALGSVKILIFGVAYTVVAVLAKIIGCSLPSMLFNFNWRGALRIGVGMAPRAEVALIMAGVGIARGLFPTQYLGVVIMMMIITMIGSPQLLGLLFANGMSGTRKDRPLPKEATLCFEFPSPEIAEMISRQLMPEFEEEGFFVHRIHRDQLLYQFRKDSTIINFSREAARITFECRHEEKAFVNAAVYEVLADYETMIRGLRHPVDTRAIGRRMQGEQEEDTKRQPIHERFDLSKYLSVALIRPSLEGTSKAEIIDELLGMLQQASELGNLDEARSAVWAREQSMSTGMQFGVAIPHGKSDSVAGLVCAIGIKREGVEFDSIDGEPSRIFVITLSPKNAVAPHLKFMSTVSQVLSREGRERVLACDTADQIYDVLIGANTQNA